MDYKHLYDKYSEDGFVKIERFYSDNEVADFERSVHEIVGKALFDVVRSPSFSVPKNPFDEYFLNSGDKISYFFDPDTFNNSGEISAADVKHGVARVGYALHWWNPFFKKMTFCDKIKDLVKNFGCKNPLVTDGQLTFQKTKIDEDSSPHQISTFLYTNPPTAVGIFVALEDADTNSGCLWFLPGSHKGEIFQRFVRNPEGEPLMIMKGEIPEAESTSYVPLPVKAGDLVLMHGSILHKYGMNRFEKGHAAYSFHIVEEEAEWSGENWLQPTERLAFPSLYAN